MLEIKGKVNTAICYASVIEEEAIEQTMNSLRAAGYESCRMCTRVRAARSVRP